MAVFDLKNATIKINDGTAVTPNELTIVLSNGQFSHSESRPVDILLDRGILSTMRKGNQEAMQVDFTAQFEYYTASSSEMTIADALKGQGEASAWESTNSDSCAPYVVDLILENIPACTGDQKETLTFPKFYATSINVNYESSEISISGVCLAVEPTAARADQD